MKKRISVLPVASSKQGDKDGKDRG
jgi:hypothetical protein